MSRPIHYSVACSICRFTTSPQFCFALSRHSYDEILQDILADLGQPDIYTLVFGNPRVFGRFLGEVLCRSTSGALGLNADMVAELRQAFLGPGTTVHVSNSASPFKVPSDVYMASKVQRWRAR